MYLIKYWFPHGHFGGGSSLRMKEWVSRLCPMRNRVRVVSSLLVLLGSSFLSFKIGCIWKILLWGFSSHNCCHFLATICLIFGLRSVYGVLMFLSGVMLIVALANELALSLPWIHVVKVLGTRFKFFRSALFFFATDPAKLSRSSKFIRRRKLWTLSN